ncbi:glycoside hydrolase family 9 protein [Phaffia rhodozyma]|uniref:cellulase n=1 Tax=Phaffia rhodozyma TaxID=264483 RepID=A0A0F7ST51_PHARH|nr:glycoside hydrolase family 9 protein [Phaffia rhodozyma]
MLSFSLLALLSVLANSSATFAQNSSTATYNPPPVSSGVSNSSLTSVQQWSNLLGNALYFYDAQRSGQLPDGFRVSWRNSSALNDGQDIGVDLSGGFYDAGDYLKCTFPLTFVLSSIAWGGIDYGQAYDTSGQTSYLDGTLQWGLDWLIKAHPESNTLIVQVGSGTVDNNYWGDDLDIPSPRPSYQINGSAPGTDAAASAAAAFASNSFLYAGQSLNYQNVSSTIANSSYASTLLQHAKDLYTFATTSTLQVYQTDVPAVADVYGSSGYGDDLVWAGLWLSLAANDSTYFTSAASNYAQYGLSGKSAVLNWDSKVPALPILFTQIAISKPWLMEGAPSNVSSVSYWQSESEKILDQVVNEKLGKMTKGGLVWFEGDSDSASLNPALNIAMLLRRYGPIASTTAKQQQYLSYAQDQVDYFLGNNPMSVPYVVGSNPNSPTNPHSAMASGGQNIQAIDTEPVVSAHVLYGAVVGGPSESDKFWNIRSDWVETEVALDYNAPLLTLVAQALTLNASSPPYYTSLQAGAYSVPSGQPCDAALPCSSKRKLSTGAIIAIVVVILVVLLVLSALAGWWFGGWFGGSKRGFRRR